MTESESGKRMTLGEHLEELRSRIIRSLLATLVGFILTFIWVEEVIWFLGQPLDPVIDQYKEKVRFIQTHPAGAFIASMKIAFFAGIIVSLGSTSAISNIAAALFFVGLLTTNLMSRGCTILVAAIASGSRACLGCAWNGAPNVFVLPQA